MKIKTRIEKDSIGTIEVPINSYWGPQTQRSLQNFTIGVEKMPNELIKAIVYIKKSCATANNIVKKLDLNKAKTIASVCDLILQKKLDGNFPLSIWQTGSGTQTNMNVNEVIANKANELLKNKVVHPNDHVNMSQSSNDVFPSAMHVCCALLVKNRLLPELDKFIKATIKLEKENSAIIKIGRTHLQDATPIKFAQEISAWGSMLQYSKQMIEDAAKYLCFIPIGGTAVGTGLNAPKSFDALVCKELTKNTKINFKPMNNKFHGLSSKDALSFFHASLKVLAENLFKISNDIRWLSSGPNCGINEIFIPQNEPGSSIMPGKVNPTQSEAMMMLCIQVMSNDTAITIANSQGNFQLNTFMPLVIHNLNQSINLLSDGMDSFARKCLSGIKPNLKKMNFNLENSLMLVTALNSKIGYDKAAQIVKTAQAKSISLKQAAVELKLLSSVEFDKLVDPKKMV